MKDFPPVFGLAARSLELQAQNYYLTRDPAECLGLADHSFITPGPVLCSTFSKSLRKGKEFELSGTDPFNRIMLPLINAVDYAFNLYKLPHAQQKCFPNLVLSISVLDAPMAVAHALTGSLEFVPWIRIVRQEPKIDKQRNEYHGVRHYVVDVVHKDYLMTFITDHVFPFANLFVERTSALDKVLATCQGAINDPDKWTWRDIVPRRAT